MWCNLITLWSYSPGKKRFYQFIKTNVSLLCLQSETKFFSGLKSELEKKKQKTSLTGILDSKFLITSEGK